MAEPETPAPTPAPIPTYTPFGHALLAGIGWGLGLLLLYAVVDYSIDGKLDLRRLRR